MGARNKADATVHTVEKALKDLGDKVSEDEKKTATDADRGGQGGDERR